MRPARTFPVIFLCLLLMGALAGWVSPAAAQQQEKRIALVVGDGAYSKSPLATAANDAGLVAQNLQAAGFDVIGARDLDGDTLRKSFHDFMQKAEASGQNTVAMIYLAGYGVQLAGENYFIPVDTDISRDTDIPTEGIRISDYTHQLASLPLKASIVVLDAARQQPFIEGNSQIASGLALVDPENNMLIAYNAAPGTVAPSEPGPYGIYAQSLAEMIRTGGLALPDVFDRLRMRVNEATKGAQVPWDAQKIQAQFVFFDRAPDAPPAQGPADQVAAIRTKPIRELPAQEAYSAAIARDTLQGYEDFVLGFPSDPMAARVRAIIAARREAITWRRTYIIDTPQAYWSYLRRYPDGPHAWDARRRLTYLSAALEPPPSFAMVDYDVPPPPPAEFAIIDRPVVYFGDPVFGFAPPPPPPVFFLPPPPPDFVVLPPPFPVVGLFVLPQPRFVAMPAFVVAPAYVAPPPNNIVFNNIHNTTVINNVINVQTPPPPPGNVTAAVTTAASTKPVGATIPPPPVVRTQAQKILANPTTANLTPSQKALVKEPTASPAKLVVAPTNRSNQGATIPPGKSLGTSNTQTGTGQPGTGQTGAGQAATGGATSPNNKLETQSKPGTAPGQPLHPESKLTTSPSETTQQKGGHAGNPTSTATTSPSGATGHNEPLRPNEPSTAAKPSLSNAKPESLQKQPETPSAKPTAKLTPTAPKPEIRHEAAPPPVSKPSTPHPAVHAATPPPMHQAAPPPHPAPPPPAAHAPPPPAVHAAAPPPRPPAPPPRPPAQPAKKCKPGEKC
ncbi:MAG TPA: caspase family protein [Bradyrhizobium sp.]|nr:caspase family protein [Bradyrhizobium sp.]